MGYAYRKGVISLIYLILLLVILSPFLFAAGLSSVFSLFDKKLPLKTSVFWGILVFIHYLLIFLACLNYGSTY